MQCNAMASSVTPKMLKPFHSLYCLLLVAIYLVTTTTWLATAEAHHYTEAEVEIQNQNSILVQSHQNELTHILHTKKLKSVKATK